ncbi:hypothetical protein Bca4012_026876 [Brassica carinata]
MIAFSYQQLSKSPTYVKPVGDCKIVRKVDSDSSNEENAFFDIPFHIRFEGIRVEIGGVFLACGAVKVRSFVLSVTTSREMQMRVVARKNRPNES